MNRLVSKAPLFSILFIFFLLLFSRVAVAAPSITSLSPTTGAVGASVTITGTGFGATQGTSTVKFNGTTATITSWSATSIVAKVPTGATTGNVVVTVSGVASNGKSFTVVAAPSITSLSPTSGAVGASVTIAGANFGATQGSSTVKFNGTSATPTSWSATTIQVPVPSGATTGNVVVHASGVDSNGKSFTVVAAPSITTLAPTSGAVGVSVTITGTAFGATQGSSTVKFNGTSATPTSWSATTIKAPVPSGATTGNVVVHASGVDSNGKSFTVLPTPSITSLSPTSGMVGDSVTITGTNFGATQGTSTVKFNGTAATPTSWSDTSVVAPVPAGATTGNVIVTVSGVASAGVSFTVVATPSITSLSPTSGAVGTTVTINGTNFQPTQGTSTVTFNGTPATPTSWSATQIKAPAPGGATTGPVVVTAFGLASNGVNFTVKPTPSITGLSQTIGSVGMLITISGANFGSTQGSSTVKFNGTSATPTSWSATQITVPVPTGATTGNVVVHTSGVDTNGVNFTVSTVTSIAVTPQNVSLPLKSIERFTATATYANGTVQALTGNATWTSSATSIVTIGTSGLLTAIGQGQATIQAAFGSVGGSSTVSVTGPTFTVAGNLHTARWGHTATLLPSGQVLVVGGQAQDNSILTSAELYDPTTGIFSLTGSLATARVSHTATLLSNGKVLITGGYNFVPAGVQSLASTELYDPATGTFSGGPRMNGDHFFHTATLLNDGTVLIGGGHYLILNGGGGESPSELYDPVNGTFTITSSMVTTRGSHTATKLNDGTVLLAGGVDGSGMGSAEIYDPSTGAFTATGSSSSLTYLNTATLLNDGSVLVTGGACTSCTGGGALPIGLTYDPVAKIFTNTANLNADRNAHTATLLSSGQVLVVGGQGSIGNTGSAELYDPSSRTFIGAGSLAIARWSHTATLLNDGTVLFVGGNNNNAVGLAELYTPGPPPPYSLQITPSGVTMVVGETRQFTVIDVRRNPRLDAVLTVSDESLATIAGNILTALAPGQVTLTATAQGVTAQAQITIVAQGSLVPGNTSWSLPPVPGFSALQIAQAVATDIGPDIYSIQLSSDGTQAAIQALTANGQQLWQNSALPVLNNNNIPDAFGGLIVTANNTCKPGQTVPMQIVDLDPIYGQPLWQITAQPTMTGFFSPPLYCYPEAPQMAIRQDGSVVIVAPGNTSGLPELFVVDGMTGGVIMAPTIPASTYTNPDQSIITGYSPIGPPIVDSTGAAYLEYEVRTIAYPPRITTATIYLLKIAADGSTSTTQLSTTSNDENLFPGRILPDGQGGVLATWSIDPSTQPPVPSNPYQAAYVVSGSVVATYGLPFSPMHVTYGKYPALALGQNGIAFATDGTDSDNGPQVTSFNLSSGAVNWSYRGSTGSTLTILAAADTGGLAINDSQTGIIQLDPSGTATQMTAVLGGVAQYSWSGSWYVQGPQGVSSLVLPLLADPAGVWATPSGNPAHSGTAEALCECEVQTSEGGPVMAPPLGQGESSAALIAASSIPNCPICDLPAPAQNPSCLTVPGSGPAYVLLVGDPGLHGHNAGHNFDIVAQTATNNFQASGNKVTACRVSSVQNVVTALTANGLIDGGVIYYGHGGPFTVSNNNVVVGTISILAPGQGQGQDTNVSFLNVSQLSAVLTALNGSHIMGPNAAIYINGCSAAISVNDYYAGYPVSIAQLISNKTHRGVYAYTQGMYFSLKDAAHATSRNYLGEPNPLPASLPLYLIPSGPPGHKPQPVPFISQ